MARHPCRTRNGGGLLRASPFLGRLPGGLHRDSAPWFVVHSAPHRRLQLRFRWRTPARLRGPPVRLPNGITAVRLPHAVSALCAADRAIARETRECHGSPRHRTAHLAYFAGLGAPPFRLRNGVSGGPQPDSQLEQALERWSRVVGPEHVTRAGAELAAAETATFATAHRIPAILRPGDRGQVQACLRVANECRVPVYPISSGKNWGYGSRVPPRDGCVLLDLGRLNRILDFNEELAYVTIEPGVTQTQLFAFLRGRNSRLWMDATGSSPDCSVIGNVMERGFGHTPYGDHFSHVCGFEVVLPSGELLHTGPATFANARTAAVNRWGLGPSLDGLFSQSNLGIVTR
ncbi:MAG: FAD-dependent oxidoreductase, partial [Acidobacteriia bacterium]|nr:FAD-dependent oxidoreductase [Terriglobia bacterium]